MKERNMNDQIQGVTQQVTNDARQMGGEIMERMREAAEAMSSTVSSAFPYFNLEDIMRLQRRNIDTMIGVNRIVATAAESMMQRHAEMMSSLMEDFLADVRVALSGGDINEVAARQMDHAKTEYEKLFASIRELVELAASSNKEAAELISRNVREGIDDIKERSATTLTQLENGQSH